MNHKIHSQVPLLLISLVSTSWHTEEDSYRAPPIDRSILPTAPRSAREPNIDRSRLPRSPPYTAFLGNLPYDVTEDSIKDFFRGLAVGLNNRTLAPNNSLRVVVTVSAFFILQSNYWALQQLKTGHPISLGSQVFWFTLTLSSWYSVTHTHTHTSCIIRGAW